MFILLPGRLMHICTDQELLSFEYLCTIQYQIDTMFEKGTHIFISLSSCMLTAVEQSITQKVACVLSKLKNFH